ncbi:hypothetical protein A5707_05970 [Mycobacterium kyorinense]|uniref:Uncharacterized protein n=1 Tax=Mycobacterium kyorinense TaxID=487514 RepID=A0A1A2YZ95_9MYCO|nr:hypothetical protein [Mycobacterium kyorinense]OBI42718.1 hypothetical protein A5707_05970 [Mycobacterium kyorinense]
MPDWTYQPLSPIANAVLGERRTQTLALRFLAFLVTRAGGRRWIPWVFDHPPVPPRFIGRLGASVPLSVAREAVAVLPVQGASVIEIGPVTADDVKTVRVATADRRCPVIAMTSVPEVADAVAPYVDAVTDGSDPHLIHLDTPRVSVALDALSDASATVLARPGVLVAAGPGWFQRVIEASIPTSAPPGWRDVPANPRRWPGWLWGVIVGVGMIAAGLGAAAIALGPVLLWYDRAYLSRSVADLHDINHHLIGFLQHDRLTMAGNMIGIGVLYLGLAWGGLRQGYRWARNAFLISGLITFLTLFYFLVTGFVEPMHTLVVVALFPMFVLAVWHPPADAHWPPIVDGPEMQRRRALWGQLIMIGVGAGLTVAGIVISTVGLTTVFVPTDLEFLATSSADLQARNESLLPFIAHDRAGFGGALIGAGLAVLLISLWGWRRGQRWVWWSLLLGCFFGTAPALTIHVAIGYTHFEHLLPVYVLVLAVICSLMLSRPYLTAPVGHR